MRDWFIDKWLALRNRPLAIIGLILGLAIVAIVSSKTVNIVNNHIDERAGAANPCNHLTTRECALKLFGSLSPEERRDLVTRAEQDLRREAALRREARRRQGNRRPEAGADGGSSEGDSGSRRPGSDPSESSPGTTSPTPPSSGSPGTTPTSPPSPPGGGSPGGGSSGGSGGSPRPPIIHVPPVTVSPPVNGVPPIRTPEVIVPCIPAEPLITCKGGGQ